MAATRVDLDFVIINATSADDTGRETVLDRTVKLKASDHIERKLATLLHR